MKNRLNLMWTYIKKGLVWADNHKKKTLLLIIVVGALVYGISYLFSIKIEKQEMNLPTSNLAEKTGEISLDSGQVLIYENETKEMYIDTETTNITIIDKETKTTWDTLGLGAVTYDSKGKINEVTSKFASPFVINYFGQDGSQGSMNAYKYSIKDQDYTIHTIENGVQVVYELKDKTLNVFEHLPKKIKMARYDEFIDPKMQEALANGELSEDDVEDFTMLWNVFYSRNIKEEVYIYSVTSLPPTSSIELMIRVLETIGYNQDELVKDNQAFGEITTFEVRTTFKVVIETTLDGDDLIVKIPSAYVGSNNNFDQISSISVYPYFGNMSSDTLTEENPGYIFIPDGSGALIALNDYDSNYPTYSKPVYDNNQYDEYYLLDDYEQDINMPVFGIYGNTNDLAKGFLAIIENGAETAKINAQSADTSNDKIGMNQVNAQFDVVQTSFVKLFGYYAEDTTSYLSTSKKYDFNAVVRYQLLVEEKIDYFTFATLYQNYLIDQYDLELDDNEFKPSIFIDLIGNVTVLKHFLGIPYSSDLSMTTYDEAITILNQLEGVHKVVNYKGAINDGLNQSLLSKIEFVKENGSYDDFKNLKTYLEANDEPLYVDLKFSNVYDGNDNGFSKKMGIYGLDSKPLELYRFNLASKIFDYTTTPKYILSPSYLSSVVDLFIEDNEYFTNISLNDLGNTYLVDFNKQNKVSPFEANAIVDQNLKKLTQYNLMLNDPYIHNIQYAKYIENVGRQSTNHYMFAASIPFKQLVMNGLVEYGTLDVNINTSEKPEYYLLQALELGSHPKFTLSYKDASILKETEFNYYYSTQYLNWIDTIEVMYEEYVDAFDVIGTNKIVDHEILANNVFKTTYDTGVSVVVNYNDFEVVVNDQTIDALSYQIESGVA